MAKYTNSMQAWAKIYTDTFVNESIGNGLDEDDILNGRNHNFHIDETEDQLDEATPTYKVDAKYVTTALSKLAPLKTKNPQIYDRAEAYLKNWLGKQLVLSPEDFASARLKAAGVKTSDEIVTKSSDQSRQDIMNAVAQRNKDISTEPGQKEQQIKSIWVKSLNIVKHNEMKSIAKLQLTYMDGSTEDTDFNIGTTQSTGGYVNEDRLYKSLKRDMPGASDEDIRLAMIRVAFNDYRIQWFYGKDKSTDKNWSFSTDVKKIASKPEIKSAAKEYATNRVAIYKNGSTTIYRTE